MKNPKIIPLFGLLFFVLSSINAFSQESRDFEPNGSKKSNLQTSVPFLLITPSSRYGAMGNSGVAVVDADANGSSINMASMAFLAEGSYGISINHSPWLKSLVPDMSLSYLSGYCRLDDRNTLGASLRYFSIGDVSAVDENYQSLGVYNPYELAIDLNYARAFGPEFSLGGAIRFINSNLYGQSSQEGQTGSGKALALDISALYKKEGIFLGTEAIWSTGLNISNIGTKISYNVGGKSYLLPGNLKIGGAATLFGNDSRFTIALDLNKLLVPTQPIYDSAGKIVKGKDPDKSVPSGIIGSFSDAPGGLSEELREIGISTGIEFCFKERFSLRAGYNYQNPDKGDSSYLTTGIGYKYNFLSFDFAYLVGSAASNPLANTLRFGLQATFAGGRKMIIKH